MKKYIRSARTAYKNTVLGGLQFNFKSGDGMLRTIWDKADLFSEDANLYVMQFDDGYGKSIIVYDLSDSDVEQFKRIDISSRDALWEFIDLLDGKGAGRIYPGEEDGVDYTSLDWCNDNKDLDWYLV